MLLTVWSGVVLGAVYAAVGLGFTLSMLPSGVFNFAQGAIVVATTYLNTSILGAHGVGLVGVVGVDLVAGTALGVLCEVVCVRPLRRGSRPGRQQNELLTTIGFSTLIAGVIGLLWGYLPRAVPFPGPTAPIEVLGVVTRPVEVILVVGAVGSASVLQLWSRRTRWGQACRAVSEDRGAAALRGIDVDGLSLAGFAGAGAFGAVSAIAIGPIAFATPALAVTLSLGGFAAIALGGHGEFLGCLLGGLLVGLVSALATSYLGAAFADVAVFAVLVVSLLRRPHGLGAAAVPRHV